MSSVLIEGLLGTHFILLCNLWKDLEKNICLRLWGVGFTLSNWNCAGMACKRIHCPSVVSWSCASKFDSRQNCRVRKSFLVLKCSLVCEPISFCFKFWPSETVHICHLFFFSEMIGIYFQFFNTPLVTNFSLNMTPPRSICISKTPPP